MNELVQSAIVGIITGVFSAGSVWGVLKTELKFMRRDLNEVRHYLWPERRSKERLTEE